MDSTVVINPATGAAFQTVPSNGPDETDAAIERAHRAFLSWRQVAPGDRARLLRRFAAVVDAHIEQLAGLEVRNSGHTVGNARWEAGNVRDVLDFYAGAPERLSGRQIPVAERPRRHIPRAARRGRHHRAVELPDADRRLGLRARARRGQHRGAQAQPS
nr:hypothetical protein GCM10020092_018430 [Actinoplanes digitatis]